MRRKLSSAQVQGFQGSRCTPSANGDARADAPRVHGRPAAAAPALRYREALAQARALGLFGALALAPLGLAGSVAACGGAAPVHAYPVSASSTEPLTTIAPPAPGGPTDGHATPPTGAAASAQPAQSEVPSAP